MINKKSQNLQAFTKILESLAPPNQKWAQDAPIFIVVAAKRIFQARKEENHWAIYDTGAAAQTMTLAAASMGLMLHSMGGFNPESLRKSFNIGEDFQVMAVMALGYEGEESTLTRTRKPIENLFFFDKWVG